MGRYVVCIVRKVRYQESQGGVCDGVDYILQGRLQLSSQRESTRSFRSVRYNDGSSSGLFEGNTEELSNDSICRRATTIPKKPIPEPSSII